MSAEQVETFLHPQFVVANKQAALEEGRLLGTGLNVALGAAVGVMAFDAEVAQRWSIEDGLDVIMARPETRPDDVHGMLAARGIITSRTSHAALVAR